MINDKLREFIADCFGHYEVRDNDCGSRSVTVPLEDIDEECLEYYFPDEVRIVAGEDGLIILFVRSEKVLNIIYSPHHTEEARYYLPEE